MMPDDLLAHALAAKGFMPEDEGAFLHRVARERLPHGPALEVGSYCGKSAIYLGAAAREVGGTVFTVDHHRGSEENQAGWEHHDASLVDAESGLMDTLPTFRRTIERAGLEDQVVAVVGRSTTVVRPLAYAAVAAVHRRRTRRGARPGRLRRVRAVGDARWRSRDPRRVPATRRTVARRRTTCSCGRCEAAPSTGRDGRLDAGASARARRCG